MNKINLTLSKILTTLKIRPAMDKISLSLNTVLTALKSRIPKNKTNLNLGKILTVAKNRITINQINLTLTVILTLVMSYTVSGVFWHIFAPEPKSLITLNTQKITPDNLRVASNIFGSKKTFKKAPKLKKSKKPKKIKLSPLNLDLIGILFKNSNRSLVMIVPSGSRKSKVYGVGDKVKPDAVVKTIKADSVIFQRGDQTEELYLKKLKKNTIISDTKNKSNTYKGKLSVKQKKTINNYRSEIIKNPRKLLSVVSVLPFFRGGEMLGVQVKPNKDKKIFNGLGFKSGDIIVKVNDTRVDNFNKFAKLRQTIYSKRRFDLEIKRAGETIYLSIDL